MELNDLLIKFEIDPASVIVMRHSPRESKLKTILPWLVEDNHALFNAYQQTQTPKVEKAFLSAAYLASFIGIENGYATFAGLYKIGESRRLTYRQYWERPDMLELYEKFEMIGLESSQKSCLWFDLQRTEYMKNWRGKLTIRWPGMALSYWRWANRNKLNVHSISEESLFVEKIVPWDQIVLTHAELENLPRSWREELSRWRGIYYIFDSSNGLGYVGSAYGKNNLYQRWVHYSTSGDGGNKMLKGLKPANFRFSILQILPHDMRVDQVCAIEATWKKRLHTREFGLNAN